jgi:hypothetical protein
MTPLISCHESLQDTISKLLRRIIFIKVAMLDIATALT